MNVLVTNVYSWENKGDAAIVLAMIDDIVSQLAPDEIALSSHDPRDDQKYGTYEVFPSFLYLVKGTVGSCESLIARLLSCTSYISLRWRLHLFSFLRTLGLKGYWLFSAAISDKLRSYEKASIVIACGGGYLQTTTRRRRLERIFGFSELECLCLEFSLAKAFGKPYVLYNQSIGPFFDKDDERVVVGHIRDASVVICREELSMKRMRDSGLDNICLKSDIAFTLSPKKTPLLERHGHAEGHRNIGITVKKCLPGEKQEEYENVIREFMEACILANASTRFFFIPQVINKIYGDNDLDVARKIVDALPAEMRKAVHVIADDLHPGEIKYIISTMHFFVGTRMHSNIFALSSGVKTLALSYDLKTDGIMRMLGLSEYVIPVAKLTTEKMTRLFDKLQSDADYDRVLRDKIPTIVANATYDLKAVSARPDCAGSGS